MDHTRQKSAAERVIALAAAASIVLGIFLAIVALLVPFLVLALSMFGGSGEEGTALAGLAGLSIVFALVIASRYSLGLARRALARENYVHAQGWGWGALFIVVVPSIIVVVAYITLRLLVQSPPI